LDEREISIWIFLDLSKSFDLADHDILLRKITRMGIRVVALNWFQSYLENREQKVEITYRCIETNDHERDPKDMEFHKVLFLDQNCFRSISMI
jgi:hypothetical protein